MAIDPEALAASLRRLATLGEPGTGVVEALRHVTEACVHLVGVTGSGIMLADEQNRPALRRRIRRARPHARSGGERQPGKRCLHGGVRQQHRRRQHRRDHGGALGPILPRRSARTAYARSWACRCAWVVVTVGATRPVLRPSARLAGGRVPGLGSLRRLRVPLLAARPSPSYGHCSPTSATSDTSGGTCR